jgi:hypothetical protein
MADMTPHGPHTTGPVTRELPELDQRSGLSGLSMSPHFSEVGTSQPFVHTRESTERRWNTRTFDGGVMIEGRTRGGRL